MAKLVIKNLAESRELDRIGAQAVLGGSVLVPINPYRSFAISYPTVEGGTERYPTVEVGAKPKGAIGKKDGGASSLEYDDGGRGNPLSFGISSSSVGTELTGIPGKHNSI